MRYFSILNYVKFMLKFSTGVRFILNNDGNVKNLLYFHNKLELHTYDIY